VVWKEEDTMEVPEVDMGVVMTEDLVEEEVYPPHVLTTKILVISPSFC
jgi:hypothetical protein